MIPARRHIPMKEAQRAASAAFYSSYVTPTIERRKIRFSTNGGSHHLMTRREVEQEIGDIESRLATKVRSANAMTTLNVRLSALRTGLSLARSNGL